ncbi:MAG: hypothetical protein KA536_15875 [Saprospiraceae bacterium]|nr:hypothetical protein [Saprospiraceae bacterium]
MTKLDNIEMVDLWESFDTFSNENKQTLLLSKILKPSHEEEISNWTIEKIDYFLFKYRCLNFGYAFKNLSVCPKCNHTLEWEFNYKDFNFPAESCDKFEYNIGEDVFEIRLPKYSDLKVNNQYDFLYLLLQNPKKEIKISEELLNELLKTIEFHSPHSSLSFSLNCAHCVHSWNEQFDISNYLIKDINSKIKHLLYNVHLIASRYNWDEDSILKMSDAKRKYYLNLINEA